MNNENSLMTIEAVSRQLRIPKHTLRFWEKEFEGILIPSRTPGGQRRYTLENIVRIEEINRLRRNGRGLSEIKRRLIASDQGTRTGSDRIDLLASRVAEVVKAEVSQFFQKENRGPSIPD
jgi:DNA-binding transcriptional MerR regulator